MFMIGMKGCRMVKQVLTGGWYQLDGGGYKERV
jgi:hypothetical protein